MEYINRLIGAISGLLTLMFIMSFRYWNTKRKIVFEWDDGLFNGFSSLVGSYSSFSVLQPLNYHSHAYGFGYIGINGLSHL